VISAWRLSDQEFSKTQADMVSAHGAATYGGRWNSRGRRVLYCSESLALASMELLVHIQRNQVLQNQYNSIKIEFSETHVNALDLGYLPQGWDAMTINPAVAQSIGDQWYDGSISLVLRVPSVVVRESYNYLINMEHPDIDALVFGNVTPYQFDPRLAR